jgi:CheY-like chemotaxis protein
VGILERPGFSPEGATLVGLRVQQVILIVDDDEPTRSLIEQRLRHQGFPTASAASGRAALGLLHDGAKPCLILLNVMMPGETGWNFVERLLKNPTLSGVPVALMSANPTATQAHQRVRGGDRTFLLPKPLDVRRLVSLAASHCRCRLPAANPP